MQVDSPTYVLQGEQGFIRKIESTLDRKFDKSLLNEVRVTLKV